MARWKAVKAEYIYSFYKMGIFYLIAEIQLRAWQIKNIFDDLGKQGCCSIRGCDDQGLAVTEQQQDNSKGNSRPSVTQVCNVRRQEICPGSIQAINGKVYFGPRKSEFDNQANN